MLGPKPDAPEHEVWNAVVVRNESDDDTNRPRLTAYGIKTGDEILWIHTATDLTAPEVRDRYRRRCQLMAAAPDLLEAAQTVLTTLETYCNACERRRGRCFADDCAICAAMVCIKDAVAKAEGRAEEP